jgi:hypothetical protein
MLDQLVSKKRGNSKALAAQWTMNELAGHAVLDFASG